MPAGGRQVNRRNPFPWHAQGLIAAVPQPSLSRCWRYKISRAAAPRRQGGSVKSTTMVVNPEGEWVAPGVPVSSAASGLPEPTDDPLASAVEKLGFIKLQ